MIKCSMKWLVSLVFVVFSMFFVVQNVDAASAADTNTYFNTGRSSGVLVKDSSKVVVDKAIPAMYSFSLGKDYNAVTFNGGIALTDAQKAAWIELLPSVKNDIELNQLSLADNSIKGKFYARYENVGTYNGKKVDAKLTIMDFEVNNWTYYGDRVPFVAFYKKSSGNGIGVYVEKINWVKVKYEFYENGKNKLINVKGYTTYWDIDGWQGIHLLDNNKGLYSSSKSKLKVASINDSLYVYDDIYTNSTALYNKERSITEVFAGTGMTRLYTFVRPHNDNGTIVKNIWDADGGIWNSAIVNGALKSYAKDTPAGADNSAVKVGDEIKYQIQFTNGDPDNNANVIITDTISKGLEYVTGSAKLGDNSKEPTVTKNSDGTTTLKWETTLAKASTSKLTYSAKVTNDAISIVSNNAKVKIGDHEYQLDKLKNPIPSKNYASDTPNGMNGAEVTTGNTIKYSIKYANAKSEKQNIVITDIISKGIEYISGSSNLGEPSVTKNSDGGYTLVWNTSLEAGQSAELTYSVKVTGGVKQVNNNASIKFGDDDPIQLNELRNPLVDTSIVKIPDTGNSIAIIGMVAGVLLIGLGGYVIYKQYKKA